MRYFDLLSLLIAMPLLALAAPPGIVAPDGEFCVNVRPRTGR